MSEQHQLLQEADRILAHAQTIPPRAMIETTIKESLQTVYPYSISSTELAERLGIPKAGKILTYLEMFGEVEKTSRGHYRAIVE